MPYFFLIFIQSIFREDYSIQIDSDKGKKIRRWANEFLEKKFNMTDTYADQT